VAGEVAGEGAKEVVPGDRVVADYGVLGRIEIGLDE